MKSDREIASFSLASGIGGGGDQQRLEAEKRPSAITNADILLVVDPQKDFLETSDKLPVKQASRAILNANELVKEFDEVGATVIFTQDFHPRGHSSFASTWGLSVPPAKERQDPPRYPTRLAPFGRRESLWPDHCVQGEEGCQFAEICTTVPDDAIIVRKGFRKTVDSYSAFFELDR